MNVTIDGIDMSVGDNITLALKTDNIEEAHAKISKLNVKTISAVEIMTQPKLYKFFEFADPWGNIWEVAEYNY